MARIVVYPSPGMSHLVAMVEFGKFILHHHPSLSVTVLVAPPSFNTGPTMDYVRHISATVPALSFHHLPAVSVDLNAFPSMEAVILEVLHLSVPDVRRALHSISPVSVFIIDLFCTEALPVATDLHIPTYYFLTSGAYTLAFFLHFPLIHSSTTKSFKDMNTLLHAPGVPPFPTSDMLRALLDRTTSGYRRFLDLTLTMPESAGLIVNAFESLEPKPLLAIHQGKCKPAGFTPPVFCVGPLLDLENRHAGGSECLTWLDKQPSKSVVYLCFGSLGLLSAAQLREVAAGLERSGQRFLWVVRSPPSEEKGKQFLRPPEPEPDLEAILPAGFLERTAEMGLVVKSWAPQVAVLNHAAVGGFVTHCGWNSILEAVSAGVPMVAWPMYAEQHFNRTVMVEDVKLALRLEMGEDGFVAAEEVETRVMELMTSEKGREMRKAVEEKSAEARAAMAEGGSSVAALGKMVELWKSAY